MSAPWIISILIVLLTALAGYGFITQSIAKKRKQTNRLRKALSQRAKDFRFLLSGFPPNFLPKGLEELVIRCLMNVTEQLAKLEPQEKNHVESLQMLSKQLEEVKRKPKDTPRVKLENPQQIKEVKQLLQELNKFILHFKNKGSINAAQHKVYEKQIKQTVVQMSVDNYLLNAKQAKAGGKTRLVVHYYTLALKLLTREGASGQFAAQIKKLQEQIDIAEQQLLEEEPSTAGARELSEASQAEASSEWNKFDEDEDQWKKKSIYD